MGLHNLTLAHCPGTWLKKLRKIAKNHRHKHRWVCVLNVELTEYKGKVGFYRFYNIIMYNVTYMHYTYI
jgi:hypothetical protein